ncbi:protoporphyrinogen oxidase [Methanomicrobium sp. W14]|uniref:NAD(P)/FAD-dependent oxidoreductase n=1 Tax=Methanomicrobium sp. W14 TaxID=2817839 RepID=UPI001AE355B3|nr:NAD(P)/FAD-dependent oxidoreductase [Methanomicrobium sp. W14]MBP2133015.1 protoporphyrinogen oxidase [Methanomicrobium sp. W14]
MDICIIGGGLSGLSAAYALRDKSNITVLEKKNKTGGCLSSSKAGKGYIEDFYHHCFSGDTNLFELAESLGIIGELEWLSGSTGYYVNNKIYPLTTPLEILKYPYLSVKDKIKLGILTLHSKKYDVNGLDDISAKDFIVEKCGISVYESFFEPLLNSKFGDIRGSVSAAWLISRIAIRSDRKISGEKLGYFRNGYNSLTEKLTQKLKDSGCIIETGNAAEKIIHTDSGWEVNGTHYDAVLSTINPSYLEDIGGPKIGDIPYQGAACMTIGLKREVTEGIYWLNMKDKAPYGAVIGHTNFVPQERYNEHIVYLASYFTGIPPEGLEKAMIDDFSSRFKVRRDEINWYRLNIDESAGPVYVKGYKKLIPEYEKDDLFLAGMFSLPNYPERSMEGSIVAGKHAASEIIRKYNL